MRSVKGPGDNVFVQSGPTTRILFAGPYNRSNPGHSINELDRVEPTIIDFPRNDAARYWMLGEVYVIAIPVSASRSGFDVDTT